MKKSRQRTICDEILRILAEDPVIKAAGNVTLQVEDRGDPAAKVTRALRKAGVFCLISSTGHTRAPGSGESTAGDIGIEITFFENPTLSRADNRDAFTVTAAAEAARDALHWRTVNGARIRYVEMSRADADEQDYRMIVTFLLQEAPDPDKAVRWGIGEDIFLGRVIEREIARGGVVEFVPDQSGNENRIYTRNLHWTISLTCEVTDGITENDLPAFGKPFEYGGKTYYCTDAGMSSAVEDTTTVRLAGRTLSKKENS